MKRLLTIILLLRYVAQREAKITAARNAYEQTNGQQKYEESYRLYELYRPFVSDSAIYFLRQCITLAEELGDHNSSVRCRSLLAIRCSNTGLYDEALNILDSINLGSGLDRLVLGTYYEAYNNVYGELSYYTRLDDMRQLYQRKEQHYKQLMFEYLPATSESCFLRREQAAQAEGKLKEAMAINDEWMKTVEPGSHPYALVALYRYIEYKLQGDSTQMMYWLTESVLADIRNAVQKIVLSHDWALQMHGFYADTESRTIRFDAVVSFDIKPREAVRMLREEVCALYPEYTVSITPDIDLTDL